MISEVKDSEGEGKPYSFASVIKSDLTSYCTDQIVRQGFLPQVEHTYPVRYV